MADPARAAIDDYERSLTSDFRRANGVHYTPPGLARLLVDRALAALDRVPGTVCDPACGSGAFLLATADALAERGVPAGEVVRDRLVGGELDPGAAAVARQALCTWAAGRGADVDPAEVRIVVGDSLFRPPQQWVGRDADGFDLVVGNPPFLSQLSRRSARGETARDQVIEQFGQLAGYADTAALFLLRSVGLIRVGGVSALIQPQSFLAARDTAPIRSQVTDGAELVELWASDEQLFAADVRVCAPILRKRPDGGGRRPDPGVRVLWGIAAQDHGVAPEPSAEQSWGPLLAVPLGIPMVPPHRGDILGSVATATAGFRDEFYALTAALVESATAGVGPRLVTVGMIDPGGLSWGERPRRINGARRLVPRVDLDRLRADAPRVAAWAARRRRPKVLVATQTRIIEAVADPEGDCIPVTPTISVEPVEGAPSLAHLVAALLAPPASAHALSEHLGAGLSSGTLRWSARAVLQVGLPADARAWDVGADLVERLRNSDDDGRGRLLAELAVVMTEAHGLDADHPVVDWWLQQAKVAERFSGDGSGGTTTPPEVSG